MRKIQGQCLLPCREWGGNQGLVSATVRHSSSATALPVGSGSQNQAVPTEAHLAQSPPQHSFREQRNQTETTNQRKRTLTLHLNIRKTHKAFLSGEPHSQTPLVFQFIKSRIKMIEVNHRLLSSHFIKCLNYTYSYYKEKQKDCESKP